jgi:hypothetical protein
MIMELVNKEITAQGVAVIFQEQVFHDHALQQKVISA